MVAEYTEIVVSMDWTEFDADDHSTLVISLQTSHGCRWKTHQKSLLKGQRNAHERAAAQAQEDLARGRVCYGSGRPRLWFYGAV